MKGKMPVMITGIFRFGEAIHLLTEACKSG
jgi:hypothetical protein